MQLLSVDHKGQLSVCSGRRLSSLALWCPVDI